MVRLPAVQRTRRRQLLPLVLLPAFALLSGAPSATATDGHDPCVDAGGTAGRSPTVKGLLTCTFSTSGSYSFTVPAGATSVTVIAVGGKGGDYSASVVGGKGASAEGTFSTLAGAGLTIAVGGAGGHTGDSNAG